MDGLAPAPVRKPCNESMATNTVRADELATHDLANTDGVVAVGVLCTCADRFGRPWATPIAVDAARAFDRGAQNLGGCERWLTCRTYTAPFACQSDWSGRVFGAGYRRDSHDRADAAARGCPSDVHPGPATRTLQRALVDGIAARPRLGCMSSASSSKSRTCHRQGPNKSAGALPSRSIPRHRERRALPRARASPSGRAPQSEADGPRPRLSTATARIRSSCGTPCSRV
jgi:hypothetical protein